MEITAKVGDRATITYGRPGKKGLPGYRATLLVGTVHSVETWGYVFQLDGDRGSAIASCVLAKAIWDIKIHEQPPVCTEFAGTGQRCTKCRYRRDFH
jgi:hypothetical protein